MKDDAKQTKILAREFEDLNEERVLIEWIAPERAFKTREKDFWITAVSILVLVAVIFIFIKEFFLVVALGSLLFLYYVLSTVPPANINYKITNRGIYFGESHYYWDTLEKFWLKPSLSTEMIHFGTILRFPRTVSLVIKAADKDKIKDMVVKRLPYVESSPNFVDKLTEWVAKRLPLEDRPSTAKAKISKEK